MTSGASHARTTEQTDTGTEPDPGAPGALGGDRTFAMTPVGVILNPKLRDFEFRLWAWMDWKAGTSGVAHASYGDICEAFGCSKSKAERGVKALIAAGDIVLDKRGAGHGKSHYRVANASRDRVVKTDDPPSSVRKNDDQTVSVIKTDDGPSVAKSAGNDRSDAGAASSSVMRSVVDSGAPTGVLASGEEDLAAVHTGGTVADRRIEINNWISDRHNDNPQRRALATWWAAEKLPNGGEGNWASKLTAAQVAKVLARIDSLEAGEVA